MSHLSPPVLSGCEELLSLLAQLTSQRLLVRHQLPELRLKSLPLLLQQSPEPVPALLQMSPVLFLDMLRVVGCHTRKHTTDILTCKLSLKNNKDQTRQEFPQQQIPSRKSRCGGCTVPLVESVRGAPDGLFLTAHTSLFEIPGVRLPLLPPHRVPLPLPGHVRARRSGACGQPSGEARQGHRPGS